MNKKNSILAAILLSATLYCNAQQAKKTDILEVSTRQPVAEFNGAFYVELHNSLVNSLGKKATDELISGKKLLNSKKNKIKK